VAAPAPTLELTADQVRRLRMHALLLAGPIPGNLAAPGPDNREPASVVTWFGAMQSQDLASGKWSFGVRNPGSTSSHVDAAIAGGTVLRTWPMRGTVHFVPPQDARWLVEHVGSKALSGAAARRAYLGLTTEQVDLAANVLSAALAGGRRATRGQCVAMLNEAGIPTAGQHAYHLLWYVSQLGITCMGPNEGSEGTFVRLDEWAPNPNRPSREEALGILALRYFRSHGPTTHTDFAGWMGLGVRDARAGITRAGPQLVEVKVAGRSMFATPALLGLADAVTDPPSDHGVVALPGFDEFILGFKDRDLMLDPAYKQAICPGNNGVFQPTLVHDGRVIGTWRRTTRARRVELRPTLFAPTAATPGGTTGLRSSVEAALTGYADYLELAPDVRWEAS
jgi:hypothetical protein